MLIRIIKDCKPPELSDPREIGQTPEQSETKANSEQDGGGSDKLKVNLVSLTEQMAWRAKEELLREGRERGFDGFTSEDTSDIERMKNQRRRGLHWTIIQNM